MAPCDASQDWAAAAKGLTFLNSREARAGLSALPAYAHAMLGRAQAELGQKDEARKSYQQCLDLFKDADPDLPLLVQVKDEMAKLGTS